MIDTIKLHLSPKFIPNNYLEFLKNLLTDKQQINNKDHITSIGMFKNIRVVYNSQGLRLSNSLATLKFRNNQKTLNLNDIKNLIDELSDEFQLPLINSKVLRLDIGENIITNHPPELYFGIIESAKRLNKISMPNGIELRNTNRTLCFYDKIKEQKAHHKPITRVLVSRNVLRYEYRYLKHQCLANFLQLREVMLSDIVDNYSKIIHSWADNFYNANKIQQLLLLKPEVFAQPRGLINQASILGIDALGGIEATVKLIENAKALGLIKYANQSSNQKRWVRKIMKMPRHTQKSNLAEELEQKIRSIQILASDQLFDKYLNEA